MTSIRCAHERNPDGVAESFCDVSNFAIDITGARKRRSRRRQTLPHCDSRLPPLFPGWSRCHAARRNDCRTLPASNWAPPLCHGFFSSKSPVCIASRSLQKVHDPPAQNGRPGNDGLRPERRRGGLSRRRVPAHGTLDEGPVWMGRAVLARSANLGMPCNCPLRSSNRRTVLGSPPP